VNFSEPVDRVSAEAAFNLTDGTTTWDASDGTLTWSPNATSFDFTPAPPLAVATTYTVRLDANLTDLVGNPMGSDEVWSFTTIWPPSVVLTSPAGGEDWTGGSAHLIAYATSDPDNATLDVTFEFSSDDGATWSPGWSIFDQPTGSHSYPWVVPSVDITRARVRVCVSDRVNPAVCATSGSFTIDSTPPTVASTDPPNGATNVPLGHVVIITFSEFLGLTATPPGVTFSPWVLALGYWSGMVGTFTHDPFAPCTRYTITVAAAGVNDTSDPGNPMPADYSWSFTTSCPPRIVHTPPAAVYVGDTIAVTATVTDSDSAVQDVRLVYTPVGGTEQNVSMTLSGGSYTYTIPAQSSPGTVRYRIYAVDAEGNWNLTEEYTVSVQGLPPAPGLDVGLIAAIVAILAVAIIIAALVLWRRRKKREAPPPSSPPSTPL